MARFVGGIRFVDPLVVAGGVIVTFYRMAAPAGEPAVPVQPISTPDPAHETPIAAPRHQGG